MPPPVQALFTDIGGVLLTNGWDRGARLRAVKHFQLDAAQFDQRHHLMFDALENGKIALDEYLDRVVFHEQRSFSRGDFREFMFEQSKPYPESLDLFRELRKRSGLKLAAISNETRELAEYRVRKFDLGAIFDFFVVSSFVHLRKPDPDIFRMALDLAQTPADRTAYIEDRYPFVEIGGSLGLRAIHHTGVDSTRRALRDLGLG